MNAFAVGAVISLPPVSGDGALLASAVIASLTVAGAARAVLAWQALSDRTEAARRRRQGVEQIESDVHGRFYRLREQARDVNAAAENALWALPRFDQRVADMRASLAADRATLERLAGADAGAARETLARIRGTLGLLRSARDVGRTIWE